jgi:hypothetical protein
VKTTTDMTTLHKLVVNYLRSETATCPVNRRNQILLTSQSSGKTTSELLLVMDGPIRPRKAEKKPSSCLPHKLSD